MNVDVINNQSDIPLNLSVIEAIVEEVVTFEQQNCDEVAIHFVDTAEICKLHAEFFDDPTTTDCISFPMDQDIDDVFGDYRVLGDVFVCPKTALDYAQVNNVNPYVEVTLYIVHGLLHLMGYDDVEDADRLEMRAAEKRHMENLVNKKLILYV